jgi:uncharacterized protein RhaS with RHS repeats
VISWHRFYDPETGRYISADPIGLAGGINLYAYANQNPINYVDPEGLNAALWKAIYDVTGTAYNDLYKHCYVSCKGNKMDGAEYNTENLRTQTELTNIQLGLVEVWQTFSDMNKADPSGTFEASKKKNWDRDIPSNRAGNECAEDCTQTCEDCCSKYAGGKF